MKEECTGYLFTLMTEGNIKLICTLILDSRKMNIAEMTNMLQMSHSSAYKIIHNTLSLPKMYVQDGFCYDLQNGIGVMFGHL
jgi:hypothetical protein